jgi:hypothetical protein
VSTVDELHTTIADYLRHQHRPLLRGARMFSCRVCGRRVVEGDPRLVRPFGVLWEVARCPLCYHEPPSREEAAILSIGHERAGIPVCRVCGAPVDNDEGGLYNLDDMQMRRECRDHYCPF